MKKIISTFVFSLFLLSSWAQTYTLVNAPVSEGGDCFSMTNIADYNWATAVWSNTTITISDLMVSSPLVWDFEVYLGSDDDEGHGVAFVLQQEGPNAIGMGGAGLGYGGNTEITPSVAIEIDTRPNDHDNLVSPNRGADHLSGHFNGQHLVDAPGVSPVVLPEIEDGAYHSFHVEWHYNATEPANSTLTGVLDGIYTIVIPFDPQAIFSFASPIYFGFTAGTHSNGLNDQRVSFVSAGSSSACSAIISLPVELNAFYAETDRDQVVNLYWSTASELNNDYFEVMRSADGVIWQNLGRVKGAGTTQSRQEYQYRDTQAQSANNYYKLRQVDFDGKYSISDVIEISISAERNDLLSVYPNPAVGSVNIRLLNVDNTHSYRYTFYDQMGRAVKKGELSSQSAGYQEFVLGVEDLDAGVYIVRLSNGIQHWSTRLMINE